MPIKRRTLRTKTIINVSARHVFDVLRHVSAVSQPIGIAEAGRDTRLPTSTVHRALATLEEAGFAARFEGTPRYQPGPMISHLVHAFVNRFPIRRRASRVLRELSERLSATVTLNVRLGWYCIRLAAVEGPQEFYEARRVGEVRLLHDGAAPLSILAALGDETIVAYRRFVAAHHAEKSAAAFSPAFDRAVVQIRKTGRLVAAGEQLSGAQFACRPIRNGEKIPFAALAAALADDPAPHTLSALDEAAAVIEGTIREEPLTATTPYDFIPADELILDVAATT